MFTLVVKTYIPDYKVISYYTPKCRSETKVRDELAELFDYAGFTSRSLRARHTVSRDLRQKWWKQGRNFGQVMGLAHSVHSIKPTTRSSIFLACSPLTLYDIASFLRLSGWLGSRVVSVLDSGAEGPVFKSQSRCCRVTVLRCVHTNTK